MNVKGSIMDIIVWLVISFVIVLFFALWMYGHNLVTKELLEIGESSSTPEVNLTYAAESTFGQVDVGLNSLKFLAFMMIFALGMSIFVHNFLVKAHPAFFIVYVFITVIAVIFSVYISNTYEDLMANAAFGTTLASFKGATFILARLPLWTTIIGLIGAIFLFAGIIRDRGAGGSVI